MPPRGNSTSPPVRRGARPPPRRCPQRQPSTRPRRARLSPNAPSVRPGLARASLPPRDGDAPKPAPKHSLKPYSGAFAEEVTIELLDVNFTELRDSEEATVRFHPNGTADEFTIFFRIGATAARKISLDIVTGLPALEVIR